MPAHPMLPASTSVSATAPAPRMPARAPGGATASLRAGLLALALGWVAGTGRADPLDGTLEVQSAFVNLQAGVYELHARVVYPDNPDLRAALRDGVSLTFDLDVVVSRERRFWMDADIVSLTRRRELSFHSVSDRYLVRDLLTGEQQSYPALEAALEALGVIDRWPILVASQARAEGSYTVSVRAAMRRGRLSDTLRVLLFWTDDWHRTSEWYSWSLPR